MITAKSGFSPFSPICTTHLTPLQKAIKEKEFELITTKNQKLENLCRALQEERKNLYEKVQGAGGPEINSAEPTEKKAPEVQEAPEKAKDEPIQNPASPTTAAPAVTLELKTPLTKELDKLKAEQNRLKEIASSFIVSHVVPTETVISQSQGLPEADQEPQNHTENGDSEHLQDVQDHGRQEQRDLEMESVD